jgi:hypothetical protein
MYFIKYSVHMSIARTIFTKILAHQPVYLKPFLRYLQSIVHRQYFSITLFENNARYTR